MTWKLSVCSFHPILLNIPPNEAYYVRRTAAVYAIVYIAYQVFASTTINEITITSVPALYDFEAAKNNGFIETARYTAK